MSPFREGPVTVEVPATSANLGPGYDCLGLALDRYDTLTAEIYDEVRIDVAGEDADEVPRDSSHLVVRAMQAAFDEMGVDRPGLHLRATNRIPHARGLGSSSAAIVGGIVLARALVADGLDRLDDTAALALANDLEGHPDNVAPALLGGFVVTGQQRGGRTQVWAHRLDVDGRIAVVAFVPQEGVHTEVARGLLPDTVSHADAAANSGRTALLVAALTAAPEHLLRATEDFLHQRYRRPAMPASYDLVESLRARGVPAFISGAGPTVLALTVAGEGAGEGAGDGDGDLVSQAPEGWRAWSLAVSGSGARVTG